jgi:hypothetical protein
MNSVSPGTKQIQKRSINTILRHMFCMIQMIKRKKEGVMVLYSYEGNTKT